MAELTKQMLDMPGVVHSSAPFPVDAFQMSKTDDDFNLNISIHTILRAPLYLAVPDRDDFLTIILSQMNVYGPKERS
jgi:hypothetical protein